MTSRMSAVNGITNPTSANNVNAKLASLNQDQAAAYAFAHNVMQQHLQQLITDCEQIAHVANLFWKRTSNTKRM